MGRVCLTLEWCVILKQGEGDHKDILPARQLQPGPQGLRGGVS